MLEMSFPVKCSCGCDHIKNSLIHYKDWEYRLEKCSCPEYTLHTLVYDGVAVPDLWSREVEYQTYIKSKAWKERAGRKRLEVGMRCQICNRGIWETVLDVHHRTYDRLGHEHPNDMTVLCREDHELYEKHNRIRRFTGFTKHRFFSRENKILAIEMLTYFRFQVAVLLGRVPDGELEERILSDGTRKMERELDELRRARKEIKIYLPL
jgi:hypothetical protein